MESLDGPTLSGCAHRRAERHLGGLVSRLVPRMQACRPERPRTPSRIAPTSIYALYREKDADWRDHCIALSTKLGKDLPYDPRTWGRVAAYFIASKDQNNELKTIATPKASPLSYIESVA